MGGTRLRLLWACAAAAAALAQYGVNADASAATWWPSATVFSHAARIGLAANGAGSFLLVDGRNASEAASCEPGGPAFALGGPEPAQRGSLYGTGGSVIPGSPSFEPDGRSVAIFLSQVLHSEYVEPSEGPADAPARISPDFALGAEVVASTDVFVVEPGLMSATGTRGDVAVVDVSSTGPGMSVVRRRADSTEWRGEAIGVSGSSVPKALAVDGLGDTTILANTFVQDDTPLAVEVASAYFAPPGAPFSPLPVPGNYFTVIASDAAGRSAIAGYTASGPDGPGLYLSRRESPSAAFGAPTLLSSRWSDPQPQLAYDASGVLTVAWSEGNDVAVATAQPGEPVGVTQALSAPGLAGASDEQLSVDEAGEAILAWIGGPDEDVGPSGLGGTGLQGVPAPVLATVRRSPSEPFQEVHQLAAAAQYSEGLYENRAGHAVRMVDAIGAGRAMVAWLEESPSGPEVKTALYASQPGCASPPASQSKPPSSPPRSPLRLVRARHPHRDGHKLVLGYVSCPRGCAVATSVSVGPRDRRYTIAHGSKRFGARGRWTLTATLTDTGRRLLQAHPRLILGIDVRVSEPGEPPDRSRWTRRLAR
jgi:hypothetical protein